MEAHAMLAQHQAIVDGDSVLVADFTFHRFIAYRIWLQQPHDCVNGLIGAPFPCECPGMGAAALNPLTSRRVVEIGDLVEHLRDRCN